MALRRKWLPDPDLSCPITNHRYYFVGLTLFEITIKLKTKQKLIILFLILQVVLIHTEDELFEDLPEPEDSGSLCGNGPLARFGNLCGNWVALQVPSVEQI